MGCQWDGGPFAEFPIKPNCNISMFKNSVGWWWDVGGMLVECQLHVGGEGLARLLLFYILLRCMLRKMKLSKGVSDLCVTKMQVGC